MHMGLPLADKSSAGVQSNMQRVTYTSIIALYCIVVQHLHTAKAPHRL